MANRELSIVIPAHNEEKRIANTIQKYTTFFNKLEVDYRILVVINATNDRTEEVVRGFRSKRVECIVFSRGGKGFAVIEGFKDSLKKKYAFIGFVDADMATPPEAYYELYKRIRSADGVIANRYLAESKIYPNFTFRRLIVAKIFNFLVRSLFLLNNTDTQCGAKLFTAEALDKIVPEIGMTQWAFDVELLYLAKRHGLRILDVKTMWYDVAGSKIKILKSSVQMFLSIIQLRIRYSFISRLLRPLKYGIVPLWKAVQ
jgi:dolichyl-phosphate beta-glucosyltransferase